MYARIYASSTTEVVGPGTSKSQVSSLSHDVSVLALQINTHKLHDFASFCLV